MMLSGMLMMLAQATTPVSPGTATLAPPVCLTRNVQDARGVSRPFTVAVRADSVPTLVAGGFSVSLCSLIRRTGEQYRGDVCGLASSGNSAVQARLEEVFGVAPSLLCRDATTLGAQLATLLRPAN